MNLRSLRVVTSFVWVREDSPSDGDQDEVERDANDAQGVAFRLASPKELLGLLGVLAIFVLLGAGMVYMGMQGEDLSPRRSAGETLVAGSFVVTVFGLAMIKCIVVLLRSRGIYLGRDGVSCFGTLGAAWLPWDAIEQVDVEVMVRDWSTRAGHLPRPLVFRAVHRRIAFTIRPDRDVTLTGWERLLRGRYARGSYQFAVGDVDAHSIRAAIHRRLTTSR